jgi:hypothetical protein
VKAMTASSAASTNTAMCPEPNGGVPVCAPGRLAVAEVYVAAATGWATAWRRGPGSRTLENSAEAGHFATVTSTLKELLGHDPWNVEGLLLENAARFRS